MHHTHTHTHPPYVHPQRCRPPIQRKRSCCGHIYDTQDSESYNEVGTTSHIPKDTGSYNQVGITSHIPQDRGPYNEVEQQATPQKEPTPRNREGETRVHTLDFLP